MHRGVPLSIVNGSEWLPLNGHLLVLKHILGWSSFPWLIDLYVLFVLNASHLTGGQTPDPSLLLHGSTCPSVVHVELLVLVRGHCHILIAVVVLVEGDSALPLRFHLDVVDQVLHLLLVEVDRVIRGQPHLLATQLVLVLGSEIAQVRAV